MRETAQKAAKNPVAAGAAQAAEVIGAAQAAEAIGDTQTPEATGAAQTPEAPGASKSSKSSGPAKGKTSRAPASPFCRPGRPRRQKTAQQLLGRLLGAPLPPHTARLGCLESWAEGEDPAGGESRSASGPLRGCLQMYEGMLLAQMARALEGDLKALQFIRETMGERTEEKPAPETLSSGDRALLSKLAARLGLEEETP